jgi:hypothetical protein
MIINTELLISLNISERAIERFNKHFNGTLELADNITEYAVCDELYEDLLWLISKLQLSIKCINKDSGCWEKTVYGPNNNTYFESSNGCWEKREYDANNNETYYADSEGYWVKREYDSNNNITYMDTSVDYKKRTKRA